jgi:hypothetical protein
LSDYFEIDSSLEKKISSLIKLFVFEKGLFGVFLAQESGKKKDEILGLTRAGSSQSIVAKHASFFLAAEMKEKLKRNLLIAA